MSRATVAAAELTLGGHAMDRIKTFQQTQLKMNCSPTILESAKAIYKNQGVGGFYTGYRWNVMSHCGKAGIPIKMIRSSWYEGINLLVMDKLGIFNSRHA